VTSSFGRRLIVTAALALASFTAAWLLHEAAGHADRRTPLRGRLIWHDEFTGPAGAAPNKVRWHIPTGTRNGELEYFTPRRDNVSLDGAGHLMLTARSEDYTDAQGVTASFTSGAVETKWRFSTKHGLLEARIKIPAGRGLWSGFWALGSDYDMVSWPRSGEIDMMENLGDDPHRIYGSVHGPATGAREGEYAITRSKRSPVSLAGGFHIYGVRWSRRKIVFELDGSPYATVTPASLSAGHRWVFEKPFFMILNLKVGGWAGPPDPMTRFPATLLVDWVRAYADR
jgi:beta-glucanase (GH16 family)